jgi:hypothetical protein
MEETVEETIEEEERVPTNDEGGTSRRERRACGSASMSLRIALVAQLTLCNVTSVSRAARCTARELVAANFLKSSAQLPEITLSSVTSAEAALEKTPYLHCLAPSTALLKSELLREHPAFRALRVRPAPAWAKGANRMRHHAALDRLVHAVVHKVNNQDRLVRQRGHACPRGLQRCEHSGCQVMILGITLVIALLRMLITLAIDRADLEAAARREIPSCVRLGGVPWRGKAGMSFARSWRHGAPRKTA